MRFFQLKTDPGQLAVDEHVLERLLLIHPSTVSEFDNGNGPVVWILLIPTTIVLMDQFLSKSISEKELFELTPIGIQYEALYLCSAMSLKEYRRKGIAMKLGVEAVEKIKSDHPVKYLFVWAFSKEGESLAEKIAGLTGLPLKKR